MQYLCWAWVTFVTVDKIAPENKIHDFVTSEQEIHDFVTSEQTLLSSSEHFLDWDSDTVLWDLGSLLCAI